MPGGITFSPFCVCQLQGSRSNLDQFQKLVPISHLDTETWESGVHKQIIISPMWITEIGIHLILTEWLWKCQVSSFRISFISTMKSCQISLPRGCPQQSADISYRHMQVSCAVTLLWLWWEWCRSTMTLQIFRLFWNEILFNHFFF